MRLLRLSAVFALAALPLAGRADKWAPPTTQTYHSSSKAHQVTVVPDEKNGFSGQATATLSSVDGDKKTKEVWKKQLVNQPHKVFVSDSRPQVVTVDTYG